jgi:hypothetical protein
MDAVLDRVRVSTENLLPWFLPRSDRGSLGADGDFGRDNGLSVPGFPAARTNRMDLDCGRRIPCRDEPRSIFEPQPTTLGEG